MQLAHLSVFCIHSIFDPFLFVELDFNAVLRGSIRCRLFKTANLQPALHQGIFPSEIPSSEISILALLLTISSGRGETFAENCEYNVRE